MKPDVLEILREVSHRLGEANLMNVGKTIHDCHVMVNDCIAELATQQVPAQEPSNASGKDRVRITTQVGDKEPETVELRSDDLVDLFAHLFD